MGSVLGKRLGGELDVAEDGCIEKEGLVFKSRFIGTGKTNPTSPRAASSSASSSPSRTFCSCLGSRLVCSHEDDDDDLDAEIDSDDGSSVSVSESLSNTITPVSRNRFSDDED